MERATRKAIVLLATAWGPTHGGINAFNMDLCVALAELLRDVCQVACVLLNPTPADEADVCAQGIVPVTLKGAKDFDPAYAELVWLAFKRKCPDLAVEWWIGHDISSGEVATLLPRFSGTGRSAVIHHMSFIHYAGLKHLVAQIAVERRDKQRMIFEAADQRFAVGPLLRDALFDLLGSAERQAMLIPGLPSIKAVNAPKTFKAITFGRLGIEDDRIKQGRLAVASFALACRVARDQSRPASMARQPMMFVIGLDEHGGKEEAEIRALATEHARYAVNVLPLPYTKERGVLFTELAGCSVALMLSRHEGFGLTGWEAIGAQVPLIVSEESGVYQLITELFGDVGMVRPVKIGGSGEVEGETFTDEDLDRVAQAILECAEHPESERKKAKSLRELLLSRQCTWENTARTLAQALGISTAHQDSEAAPGAPPAPASRRANLLLDLATPDWPPHLEMPDSLMLNAVTESVRFHALREKLLQETLDWAEQPGPAVMVRLLTGPGGFGKTRLMREACRRLLDRQWEAGFLRDSSAVASDLRELLSVGSRAFLVIDYAETRRNDIFAVLQATLTMPVGSRVRIALLARGGGDWWERLGDAATNSQVEAILRSPLFTTGPFPVPAVRLEGGERSTAFQEALAGFAAKKPGSNAAAVAVPDLSADHFGDLLIIHLAALAALRGDAIGSAYELLAATLRHERTYWTRSIEMEGLPPDTIESVEQAIALVTLAGGVHAAGEAKQLVGATPRLRQVGTSVDRIFDLLRRLYPLSGGLASLQPDLLGERLVAQALSRDDEILDVVLGPKAPAKWARGALVVLTRMAQHDAGDVGHLRYALDRYLREQATRALEVAMETGEPMVRTLVQTIESAEAQVQRTVVSHLKPLLPKYSAALLDLAELVARLRLRHLQAKGSPRPEELLEAYTFWGSRLRDCGRLSEALLQLSEALRLAETGTRDIAHQNNVATALSNMSAISSELNKPEEAVLYGQRGEAILRKIVATAKMSSRGPMHGGLTPTLISTITDTWLTALTNLGGALSNAGRCEEGIAMAVQAERQRAARSAQRPDESWAKAILMVGGIKFEMGDFEGSLVDYQRGEQFFRGFAAQRPDFYGVLWATSLMNLARLLSNLNRHEEAVTIALEMEAVFRKLSSQIGHAYSLDWANSLVCLSFVLRRARRYEEALQSAQSAVGVLRELESPIPQIHDPYLGAALGEAAVSLVAIGQFVPAANHAREAVDLLAQNFLAREQELGDALALTLEALARAYESMNQPRDALEAAQRALHTLMHLFRQRPRRRGEAMSEIAKTLRRLAGPDAVPRDIAALLDTVQVPAPDKA